MTCPYRSVVREEVAQKSNQWEEIFGPKAFSFIDLSWTHWRSNVVGSHIFSAPKSFGPDNTDPAVYANVAKTACGHSPTINQV